MTDRWYYRKAHTRRLSTGRTVFVRGGWAHFEGGEGLTRIKHPCLHLGEGLSRRRGEDTPDLFSALQ